MGDAAGSRPLVAVIGGGVAGLAAAYELVTADEPPQVLLLERSDRVGGKVVGDPLPGLDLGPIDVGAEALLARRSEATDLARRVGLGDDLVDPGTTGARLWSRGGLHAMPPSVMGVPADLDHPAVAAVLTADEIARARRDAELPPWRPAAGEDAGIGDLVARRCGDAVTDRLVEPLLGGVYAGRARELSLAACVPQLDTPVRETGRVLGAAADVLAARTAQKPGERPAPVFAGIRGGVHRLPTATAEAIVAAGGTIRTGRTVRELRRLPADDPHRYALTLGSRADPEELVVDAVVVAVPAAPAARLLADIAPTAASDLAGIAYASMAIVTLAIDAAGWPDGAYGSPSDDGSGLLVPAVDGRLTKAMTFSHRKWPWVREAGGRDSVLLVRCSVGRLGEEQTLQRDDADLAGAAAADLDAALGVNLPRPRSWSVTRWGGALPQYGVGHLDRIRRIETAVAGIEGLAVCGAAYHGVGVPACLASGTAAGATVRASLSAAASAGL